MPVDEQKLAFKSFNEAGGIWMTLLLREIRETNILLRQVLSTLPKKKADRGTAKAKVEQAFGRPIVDILKEMEGQPIRQIADKLQVSKSLVAIWRKEMGNR